jgi:hypothetical protein
VRLDAELARLLQHRAAGRVHAAVKDGVGVLALHLGQDRLEVGCLVVGFFTRDDLDAGCLQRFLDFVGETFAIGGGIVGDGHFLGFHFAGDVCGNRRTLLVVAADSAEDVLEALLGHFRIRCRSRNHRQPGLVVDGGSGNGHTRVKVPHHASDLGVDKFLRDRGTELGVGLIVLAHHFELDGLAANFHFLGGGFVNGQMHAVFVVLAEVSDAAGQWAGMSDLDCDDFFNGCRRWGCFRSFCRFFGFFLATTVGHHQRGRDERQAERAGLIHRYSPDASGRELRENHEIMQRTIICASLRAVNGDHTLRMGMRIRDGAGRTSSPLDAERRTALVR